MGLILSIGFILLCGLLSGRLIKKIKFPSVTAYLLLGIALGPSVSNIISVELISASEFISHIVLGLIAFSLGQNFTRQFFQKLGRTVICISIVEVLVTWAAVTLSVVFIARQPFFVAFLLGAIASATAPAATVMVMREYKSKGRFTDVLLGVIAIDDAWCLIVFAISLAVAKALVSHSVNGLFLKIISSSSMEIIGSFLLGGTVAYLATRISKYIQTSTELLIYTLGFILLTTGIALKLNFSVLLANMFLGAVLINMKGTNFRFFEVLKSIDSPLYMLFFCLVGVNLHLELIPKIGFLGLIYLLFRIFGKVLGSRLGAQVARSDEKTKKYLGWGLLPQAGVALGCALVIKSNFPQVGNIIFTTIVTTTVIYELFGPICTKIALGRAGDISTSVQHPGTEQN